MTKTALPPTPVLPTAARASITITVRVDPEVYGRAREAAYLDRRSLNQWVALAIEAKLEEEERAAHGR